MSTINELQEDPSLPYDFIITKYINEFFIDSWKLSNIFLD